ncbi:MAG: Hcp family type VI secretion system effector [Cellvibrionaceae bacterium]
MSAFLHIEGIPGEVSDANHKGWIDLVQWTWGVSRQITSSTSTQGDRESSNATITDLTLVRNMDKATPKIFIETCCGRGKTIKLVQTKTGAGNGSDVFIEYTLKNALISNYQIDATNEGSSRPREEITISFVDVDMKYTQYDEDGNAEAPLAVGFNTATNIKK